MLWECDILFNIFIVQNSGVMWKKVGLMFMLAPPFVLVRVVKDKNF